MERLEEKGIDFVSLTEGIDTTTAQGRFTFHIFGALGGRLKKGVVVIFCSQRREGFWAPLGIC